MSKPEPTFPASPVLSTSTFEWRAALGPWRWLILGALGVAPSSCGGRSESPDTDRDVANLEGQPVTAPLPNPGPSDADRLVGAGSACVFESTLSGGWERCTNGMLHRPLPGTCTSALPRPTSLDSFFDASDGVANPCRRDSDCTDAAHGHCELGQGGPYCAYGCLTDADCDAGRACLCGPDIGECVVAECSSDADCAPGSLCGSYQRLPTCGGNQLACQTPRDECAGDLDCGEFGYCTRALDESSDPAREATYRSCATSICVVGRPFLIDGKERLAPSVARSDWYGSTSDARTAASATNDAIARGWLEQALMEHASVAAFARFSLQLLQLGAPADLVAEAATAMQDEIRHARHCFDLARRYSTQEAGPGPLPIEGALERMDLASTVLDTLREGCIGETVAALEASEALQHCEDAAARAVLQRIAVEEGQHAELAWRFVAWALETKPELITRVREAFALELDGVQPRRPREPQNLGDLDRELARHGLLSPPLRRALRQRVLAGVVAPCAEALLAGAGWRRPEEGPSSTALAHPA